MALLTKKTLKMYLPYFLVYFVGFFALFFVIMMGTADRGDWGFGGFFLFLGAFIVYNLIISIFFNMHLSKNKYKQVFLFCLIAYAITFFVIFLGLYIYLMSSVDLSAVLGFEIPLSAKINGFLAFFKLYILSFFFYFPFNLLAFSIPYWVRKLAK